MKVLSVSSFEEVQKRFEAAAEGMALSWTMHYAGIGLTMLVLSLWLGQQPYQQLPSYIFAGMFVFLEFQAYRWFKKAQAIRDLQSHVLTER